MSADLIVFELPLRSGCCNDWGGRVLWVFVVSFAEFLDEDRCLTSVYEHLWSVFVDVVAEEVIKIGVFDCLVRLEHLLTGRLMILGMLGRQSLRVYWLIQALIESKNFFAIQHHHFAVLRRHGDLKVLKPLRNPFLSHYLDLTVEPPFVEALLLLHLSILILRRTKWILLKIEGKQARLILILNPLIIWIHLIMMLL